MVLFAMTISYYIGWCLLNKVFFKDFLRRNKRVRLKWITLMNRLLGFRADVEGTMINETCLVISNHRSFSDPLIQLQYIDADPLAKAEVDKYPLIGLGARITGILYVTREDLRSRKGARQAILRSLERGQNVLVYPEGTTSDEPGTQEFKRGSFQIAAQLGLPIQPVAIQYLDREHHWEKRSLMQQYLLQFGLRECRCKMAFLAPIRTEGKVDFGVAETHQAINTKLAEMRRLLGQL